MTTPAAAPLPGSPEPAIQFQAGDVTHVERDDLLCSNCEIRSGTRILQIDFRAGGYCTQMGGPLCDECAEEAVADIRATLPADTEDGTVPS